MHRGSVFDRFSKWVAKFAGQPVAFAAAVALIGLWLISGPLFGFSDTWQLVNDPDAANSSRACTVASRTRGATGASG